MKKLFYFAFAAMLCCGFTACSGDDDNGNSNEDGGNLDNLLGIWTLVKDVWYSDNDNSIDKYEPGIYVIYFGPDGIGLTQEINDGKKWTSRFKYTLMDDKLRIEFDEDDSEPWIATIKSLSAEQLVLIEEGYNEEYDYSYRYESYYMRYE